MILLDTSALVALAEGAKFRDQARIAVAAAYESRNLKVSATAAWEIGLLATRTGRTSAIFGGDARRWFARAVERFDLSIIPFDVETAFEAIHLDAGCPLDPADRWTVAVARILGAKLVTSDRAILACAAQGYLDAIRL